MDFPEKKSWIPDRVGMKPSKTLRQIPDPIPTPNSPHLLDEPRTKVHLSPCRIRISDISPNRDPIFRQPHERVGRKLCTASLTSIQGGCVLHGANQPPRQHLKSQKQWIPWLSHETMMAFQSAVFKFLSWGLHFWKLTQNNGFGKILFHLETLKTLRLIYIVLLLDLYWFMSIYIGLSGVLRVHTNQPTEFVRIEPARFLQASLPVDHLHSEVAPRP